jgi:hypothetical protein
MAHKATNTQGLADWVLVLAKKKVLPPLVGFEIIGGRCVKSYFDAHVGYNPGNVWYQIQLI